VFHPQKLLEEGLEGLNWKLHGFNRKKAPNFWTHRPKFLRIKPIPIVQEAQGARLERTTNLPALKSRPILLFSDYGNNFLVIVFSLYMGEK